MRYTYLNCGVDIAGADILTDSIKKIVGGTQIGSFAGLFKHPVFDDYYLCGCTDGVGTKIIPLLEKGDTKTLANDLFAMNINDLTCCGASPVFFMDYIATNKLNTQLVKNFISDLHGVLSEYNCVLLGGETSELGDLILKNYFDVAGFLVGAVKKDKLIDKKNVSRGDVIVGLKSSGAHSNGFSLLRRLYLDGLLNEKLFCEALKPVVIYHDTVQKLNNSGLVKSCANITGGGIAANLKRALPESLQADLNFKAIPRVPLFEKLEELVGKDEAFNTFNMGVGFCIVSAKEDLKAVLDAAHMHSPFVLGEVV